MDNPQMTLRDYFAAKVIQGALANPGGPMQANMNNGWDLTNCVPGDVTDFAYRIADAMIREREE